MNWKSIVLIMALFGVALFMGRFLSENETGGQQGEGLPEVRQEAVWCEPSVRACVATIDQVEVVLRIEPKSNIQPMIPLIAYVEVPESWSPIQLEAIGLNMDMGVNRFQFRADVEHGKRADFLLPVCVLTKMEWQLTVIVTNGSENRLLPFNFVIERK